MRYFLTLVVLCICGVASGQPIANIPPIANVSIAPVANVPEPKYQTITQTKVSYRLPSGHTHTCSRCGDVWDHAKNPSHNCQQCGTPQYYVDQYSKYVPMYSSETIQVPIMEEVKPAQTYTQVSKPVVTYTLPASLSGGCVGGNCPPSTRRLFR